MDSEGSGAQRKTSGKGVASRKVYGVNKNGKGQKKQVSYSSCSTCIMEIHPEAYL